MSATDATNKTAQRFKGAVIGCGFFSRNHLHAWRDIDGVEIVALCDADSERLNTAGQAFGIERLYTDAAAMLSAEQLDFVDIATTAPVIVRWSSWLRKRASRRSARSRSH